MTAPAAFDLFTIGHSNHPIERFLELLRSAGVTAVADVRSMPSSRRYPWFSKARLSERLEAEGIAYVPLGDQLGGRPRVQSLYRDGVADYEAMARTPEFNAGLDRVGEGARKFRVCLMCAEREPLDCHRCLLVTPALAARGYNVGHILTDGSIEPHAATEERLLAMARDETDLFENRGERMAAAYRRGAGAAAFRRT